MTYLNDGFLTRRAFLERSSFAGTILGLEPILKLRGLVSRSADDTNSASWPSFGYDLCNSRFNSSETTIGRKNVGQLNLRWTFEADAPIQNCPAVVGNTLYFGSWDGHYYAISANTGQLKWKSDLLLSPLESGFYEIRSSPAHSDGRIYFGTGSAKVHCLNAETGEELWQTLLDAEPLNDAQITCSPIVYQDMVFVGTSSGNSQIACLDAETGKVRWKFFVVPSSKIAGGAVWTAPAIDEEHGILYNVTGSVKGFQPAGPMLYTESVLAHDLYTGEHLWYYQPRPADTHDLDFGSHPMIFDAVSPLQRGAVRQCVGAGKKDGFYCLDRYTGEKYWRTMLTDAGEAGGPRMSSTAVAYNQVFMVSNANPPKGPMSVTAALNAYTGEIEWWVPNMVRIRAPVAVANGVFYQGLTDGNLEALDTRSGRQLWRYQLPSPHRGGFAIANGILYASNGELSLDGQASTDRYSIYAFSTSDK